MFQVDDWIAIDGYNGVITFIEDCPFGRHCASSKDCDGKYYHVSTVGGGISACSPRMVVINPEGILSHRIPI